MRLEHRQGARSHQARFEDSRVKEKWHAIEATAENKIQVWAPADFLRGFCSLEDGTEVRYKCDGYFDSKADSAVRWNDSDIGIDWPVSNPILSDRDKLAPYASDYFMEPI